MKSCHASKLSQALATLSLAVISGAWGAGNELPDPDGKPADMTKPVQVYILMGQSNMLGFGKITGGEGSLEHAVNTHKGTVPLHNFWWTSIRLRPILVAR